MRLLRHPISLFGLSLLLLALLTSLAAADPATVPGAPQNVQAFAGNAQATVTWTAPASNGGSPITSFTVTSSPEGKTATVNGSTFVATVTGLTNGAAYTFTVTATNAIGTGLASAPSNVVTPSAPPPPPPPPPPSAPLNVTAIAGDGQAIVWWESPSSAGGAPIIVYTITSSPDGKTASVGGDTLTATVTGLTNGVAYTFTVTATNAIGRTSVPSAPSAPVTPKGVPLPPTNVIATAGNAFATVTWSAPTDTGGSPILLYTVTSIPGGISVATAASVLTATVIGLTNGTSYTFTVVATNAVGEGPASAPSNAVIPATVPDAPTNVAATAGNVQATVTWNAPASDGGSPILFYTVTSNPGGISVTSSAAVLTAKVTGLTGGLSYTFTVRATNAVGQGSASAPSNAVVLTGVPPTVNAGPDQTVDEGTAVSLPPATFVDPDVGETHTATITWGDGASSVGAVSESPQTVSGSHTYSGNGVFTVTVKVVDSGGLSGTDSFIATVKNVAPAVNAGPDAAINEGSTFTSSGSFTDDDSAAWTATVNYGDGSGTAALTLKPDKTFHLNHLYKDSGTFRVTVTVKDDDGGAGADMALVTVKNLPPTVDAGPDLGGAEGSPIHLNASFADAGVLDTHTAAVNWGDGVTTPGAVNDAAHTVSASHVYADNGVYTVTVTVTDNGGASGADSLTVKIANVAPVVSAALDATAIANVSFTKFLATIIDPGVGDTHKATVDWGDGSVTAGQVSSGVVYGTHKYTKPGLYTVTIIVKDDDGGVGKDTLKILVNDLRAASRR
ncbi:MAG: fibronectin type III domain-containing protein [Chloroflexi bacterium]|nr:fibronectin type III domain-containing protein [Chloroflexota bacterium]